MRSLVTISADFSLFCLGGSSLLRLVYYKLPQGMSKLALGRVPRKSKVFQVRAQNEASRARPRQGRCPRAACRRLPESPGSPGQLHQVCSHQAAKALLPGHVVIAHCWGGGGRTAGPSPEGQKRGRCHPTSVTCPSSGWWMCGCVQPVLRPAARKVAERPSGLRGVTQTRSTGRFPRSAHFGK